MYHPGYERCTPMYHPGIYTAVTPRVYTLLSHPGYTHLWENEARLNLHLWENEARLNLTFWENVARYNLTFWENVARSNLRLWEKSRV